MLKSVLSAALITGLMLTAACSDRKAPQASQVAAASGKLATLHNPNTVDPFTLAGIEGLTDPVQDAILRSRPYATPTQLHAVIDPLSDAPMQAVIYHHVFVRVNANTAREADLNLIPSVLAPGKLAHEIDEYRPYADMKQFDRELGKYMNAADLANLKRYIFVE